MFEGTSYSSRAVRMLYPMVMLNDFNVIMIICIALLTRRSKESYSDQQKRSWFYLRAFVCQKISARK